MAFESLTIDMELMTFWWKWRWQGCCCRHGTCVLSYCVMDRLLYEVVYHLAGPNPQDLLKPSVDKKQKYFGATS